MKDFYKKATQKRKFIPKDFRISTWETLEVFIHNLLHRTVSNTQELECWLIDRAELEAVVEEDMAWRYILMNCDTENETLSQSFNDFVTNIEPHLAKASNKLDEKLLALPQLNQINQEKYKIVIRGLKNRKELFREKNVDIIAQLQQMEQEFGSIASKMTITHNSKELTLQQAAVHLKDTDRDVRKKVFLAIQDRRLKDEDALNNLLTKLLKKRHECALNADFENFRDYKFKDLGRFDYTKEDCFEFHNSIKQTVPTVLSTIHLQRKNSLTLDELYPWDMDVDPNNAPPLQPFSTAEELIQKTLACFKEIRPNYADYIGRMVKEGYMDLDSRIGKAPGGFNYPLYESNIPFIFMNAAGTLQDVETMVHECGHAIHSCLTASLPLIEFKSLPSEVAELASMSMELISMEHWHHFFNNADDLRRAKRSQLEGCISVLSWVAIVDEFQHKLYEQPFHSVQEREEIWTSILSSYDTGIVNWKGLEKYKKSNWQRQLHIFEVPFYYIEYGIAQLGAIAIWRNYLQNPSETLNKYESFLKLGYTIPIPDLYKAAGIEFSFSKEYISELLSFVEKQLESL